MTIGVGFKCEDGIVLCADSQITWPQSHKDYECKICPHITSKWEMINTFSGDPDLFKSFNDKFEDAIAMVPEPYTCAKIQDVIETVLSFFDVLNANPTDLSMLCGIGIPAGPRQLIKTSGRVVRGEPRYEYVGVGDSSLLRYLGDLLPALRDFDGSYSVTQAFYLGSYLVQKAKTYVDGCGGETHTMILKPHGPIEIRFDETYEIEQRFSFLEGKIKDVSASVFDNRVSGEALDTALDSLVDALKQIHHFIRMDRGPIPPRPTSQQK